MADAILIYNPTAGRRRQAALLGRLLPALAAGGWEPEPVATSGPGDAARLAAEAAGTGAEAVFVLGGDGTVREAAAGLLERRRQGLPAPPLAILPGGTTNVLAHALGVPAAPLAAARRLRRPGAPQAPGAGPPAPAGRDSPSRGSTAIRMLDVGLCGATPFLMMVSGGLDAHLLGRLDPALKARWGRAGIFAQGLAEWWRYRYPALAVSADGGPPVAAAFAAVCNIPYYGGRFALAPAARWDDRRLDLVLQPAAGRLPTLRFALALAGGGDLARAGIGAAPVGEAVIDGPPGTCLQVDGDLCTEALPARVRLAAETLPVLVPETG
jgi:diacylglycerol kinase family enzyme